MSIAVIGLACRFPGAASVAEYWQVLRDGRCTISRFDDEELRAAGVAPALLADPRYVKAGTVVPGLDLFDAPFFGCTPREAELMDPQQRLLLECAWEALESAGWGGDRPRRTGVFVGCGLSGYLLRNVLPNRDLLDAVGLHPALIANDRDFVTRLSYKLDLEGPSLAVSTACSTSLVAVHLACQSLLAQECDLALAGGVRLQVRREGYLYAEGGILSPDGRCRAFDARAQGTVPGDGAGVVVLKRLDEALRDRDPIRAVVRGTAVNNDGAGKVGFTAPSVLGQARVIAEALAVAEVDPGTVSYVEGHGTGTALGDPIEVAALTRAFGGARNGGPTCALGSVKSNQGHADAAAGVAGLIKTVLALEHREIPPSLFFESPNPRAELERSPFRVAAELLPWETNGAPRRAGVSAFGMGGTNAHVVLEEAPAAAVAPATTGASAPWQLLTVSARTESASGRAAAELADHLEAHPELRLEDVAYTLQVGRKGFEVRRALVARDREEAIRELRGGQEEKLQVEGGRVRELVELGRRWVAGEAVDWSAVEGGSARRRVPLPTYPFERARHWIEAPDLAGQGAAGFLPPRSFASLRSAQDDGAQGDPPQAALRPRSSLATPHAEPTTDAERAVVAIWREALGVDRIGLHDDFFDLGGDSMTAVQVAARLGERFGRAISPDALLEGSTVADLARLLTSAAPDATGRPDLPAALAPLQPHGSLPPLFLVHPVGGHVYVYRELARLLGSERPVWGLKARGLEDDQEPFATVEEMAAHYVEAVTAVQAQPPYLLGGLSFGGTVAFEMALRLGAENVALLALIDTAGPGQMPARLADEPEVMVYLADSAAAEHGLDAEALRALSDDERLARFVAEMRRHDPQLAAVGLDDVRRFLRVVTASTNAMWAYAPAPLAGPSGPVVFFRARDRRARYDAPNPELPWLDLAGGGVTVHVVPGNHVDMLSRDHVGPLAAKLARHLEETASWSRR